MININNLMHMSRTVLDDALHYYETRSRIAAEYNMRADAEILAREYRAGLELLPDLFDEGGVLFVDMDAMFIITKSVNLFEKELMNSDYILLHAKVVTLLRAIKSIESIVLEENELNEAVTKH